MRHNKTMALCMAMFAWPAMAQTNIKIAFDKFINNKDVKVDTRRSMTKDPGTGQKEGLFEIYTYTIPKSKDQLLKDVETAFEKDYEESYSYGSGVNSDGNAGINLSVGTGAYEVVSVGSAKGAFYIYSLFNDPDDATLKYRYAYAMDRQECGDVITGRLVVTYATSMRYKEQQSRDKIADKQDEYYEDGSSWLGVFNIYMKKLKDNPDSPGASVYVNRIYNMTKHAKALTDPEKTLVMTEIYKVEKVVTDDFQKSLLNTAIENLK